MREWAADHPKAKLMARKRAAILAAAKRSFLSLGYEGSSMEAIAAAADVSIMTLYRHAQSKDELFAAVIANACDPDDEGEQAEYARLLKKPLGDVLVVLGVVSQEKLADPETVALMRIVMAETIRFPELSSLAYRGLVGHLEGIVETVLSQMDEARIVGAGERRRLSAAFIDRLCGADMLRILLGLSGIGQAEQKRRAERARDEVLAVLEAAASAVARRRP